MNPWILRILETPEEMKLVEDLQRLVWPGDDTEIVPVHMLIAAVHGGGLVIGAFSPIEEHNNQLSGFVFGFPGFYKTPDGPRLMHCSHMLAVHPDIRDQGLGFILKRAQWQVVRYQEIDRMTWTYDPLQSRNAYLNIAKLGAVCNTYHREYYGEMRDSLNLGLASDRFAVDWWINSTRVNRRLSRNPRQQLELAHYVEADVQIINPSEFGRDGWPRPIRTNLYWKEDEPDPILLLEIPADFIQLKAANFSLALEWRLHTRNLFEELFNYGYLVTDFVHLPGIHARNFYVLTYGESTL
jgi:predicted GNAT superfamily acetyltransferase